jgi:hypothetical protein
MVLDMVLYGHKIYLGHEKKLITYSVKPTIEHQSLSNIDLGFFI